MLLTLCSSRLVFWSGDKYILSYLGIIWVVDILSFGWGSRMQTPCEWTARECTSTLLHRHKMAGGEERPRF